MFRMEKHVFIKLINKLQSCYGLKVSRRMSALEMVGIFVNIVSLFTFCLAGWEGTAHDTKIFYAALRNPELNFPHPPDGNQKIEFFFLFNWFLFVILNSICIICCR
ncbi:hypothetical protein CFOL_v3_24437 [Cephalotus follicularis]|uniref:DUF8040 domain-containing protein n=1 Tax=Cephalotus follicularis TaxID=3775 RepID=A0A1Q3CLN4_CEPFO|nr:hypothetical protein CFOL_v3_24437 [Cephalotus follicularis]